MKCDFAVFSSKEYNMKCDFAVFRNCCLHAIRSAAKIIQMRRDIKHNSHNYLSNTPGGVQASASQPPDPHRRAFSLLLFTRLDVVSLHSF